MEWSPRTVELMVRMQRGEEVIVSDADLSLLVRETQDDDPDPLRKLSSIPNPNRVGLLDAYIARIGKRLAP